MNVEALVRNDGPERITFPFAVMLTDPGEGASSSASVEPKVINGSSPVQMDEVDEAAAAEQVRQRVIAGGGDAALANRYTAWAEAALKKAERIRVGRTHIDAGESRRIVLQQRLRLQPDVNGTFQFETIAPSPLMTVMARGRVSVFLLLPFQDEDVNVSVMEDPSVTEMGFGYSRTQVSQRQIVTWYWQNDPVLRLGYRYN